jgi:hypothetical protein
LKYDPPAAQVLGTVDDLTAGKPQGSDDQFGGSVGTADNT